MVIVTFYSVVGIFRVSVVLVVIRKLFSGGLMKPPVASLLRQSCEPVSGSIDCLIIRGRTDRSEALQNILVSLSNILVRQST